MVPYVRNRAITILEIIGVNTYYGDGASLENVFESTLDYDLINNTLYAFRKESIEWLNSRNNTSRI